MKRILVVLIVIAGLLSCVQANCYSAGNSVEALYEEGMKFFEQEDYDRAFARFQISGEVKGYAPALNMLGVCYRDGLGTEPDIAEAERCFRLSADQGFVPAQENLKTLDDTEVWVDMPITVATFPYFYDVELVDNNFETAPDGNSITPKLTLTYRLKPEFADKVDKEDSYVEAEVRGNYVFRGITSINWESGEISFLKTPSAEMIVNLQHIALANGSASLADKFSRLLSETAGGVMEIPVPLNRLADGVFDFHSGVRGPVSPLMKSDFVGNGIFLAQLNDLRIVSARGNLRLKEFSGNIEYNGFNHTEGRDFEVEDNEAVNLEYLPLKDGKAGITRYARSVESITVPETMGEYTISEVGDYAFAYRDTLKEIILPDGLTTIGYQAFFGCRNLETIVLPESITSIGDSAFDECNINLVATVSYGSYAEQYCIEHDLLYQYVDGTSPIEDIPDEHDFGYRLLEDGTAEIIQYSGTIKRLSVPDKIGGYIVTSIGESAFEKSNIITLKLPESIVSIGENAFTLSNLVAVILPDRLQSIGRSAFNSCTSLTSITIPSGVTRISGYTFYFCTHLTDVVIPNSVTTIEKNAFGICNRLKSITIPSSVTSIEDEAFSNNELTFIVDNGSYAEQYCREHGLQFCYREDG